LFVIITNKMVLIVPNKLKTINSVYITLKAFLLIFKQTTKALT